MIVWPAGKYGSDPKRCSVTDCPDRPAWIVRPSSPAFAAPELGACATHLEEVLRNVDAWTPA